MGIRGRKVEANQLVEQLPKDGVISSLQFKGVGVVKF